MTSLIDRGVLFDGSQQAPSPSKDYINLHLTKEELHWRIWKINPHCLKPDMKVFPSETVVKVPDFLQDKDFQDEVARVFGENTLTHIKNLCNGHINFLDRLKKSLQVYIISFLELEDIAKLSQVSKHFKEICDCDQLWEHVVERFCDTVTPDMKLYAQEVGWKKVFFMNKLQLQKQIHRQKERSVDFAQQTLVA